MGRKNNQPLTSHNIKLNQLVLVSFYDGWACQKLPGVIVAVKSKFVTVEWHDNLNKKRTENFTLRSDGEFRFQKNPRPGNGKSRKWYPEFTLFPRKESTELETLNALVRKLQEENAKLKEELKSANFFAQMHAVG